MAYDKYDSVDMNTEELQIYLCDEVCTDEEVNERDRLKD